MNVALLPELDDLRFFLKVSLPVSRDTHSKLQADRSRVLELDEFNSTGLFATSWSLAFQNIAIHSRHARAYLVSPILKFDDGLSKSLDHLSWFNENYAKEGPAKFQVLWETSKPDRSESPEESAIQDRFLAESDRLSVPAAEMHLLGVERHQFRVSLVSREWVIKLLGKTASDLKAEADEGLKASVGEGRMEGFLKAYDEYRTSYAQDRDIESSGLVDYIAPAVSSTAYVDCESVYRPEIITLAALKQGAVVAAVRNGLDRDALGSLFERIDAAIQIPASAEREYAKLRRDETKVRQHAYQKRRLEGQAGGPAAAAGRSVITLDDTKLNAGDLFYVTFMVPSDSAQDARSRHAMLADFVEHESGQWEISDEAPFSLQRWELNPPKGGLEEILKNNPNPRIKLHSPLLQGQDDLQHLHQIFSELEPTGILDRFKWRLHLVMESMGPNRDLAMERARVALQKLVNNHNLVHSYIINTNSGLKLRGGYSSDVQDTSILSATAHTSIAGKARAPDSTLRNYYRYCGFLNQEFNGPLILIEFPEVSPAREKIAATDMTRALWKFLLYGRVMSTNGEGSKQRFKAMMAIISNPANLQAAITQVNMSRPGYKPEPASTTSGNDIAKTRPFHK